MSEIKTTPRDLQVSKLAENIIGSEIIKLAGEVNEKIKQGEKIFNLTIGDFNPKHFPIPAELKQLIVEEYFADQTNYPAADGMLELRNAVCHLLKERGGLDFQNDEVLIAGGARPLIYSLFRALVNSNDKVIFAVPSWNNNHYSYLNFAQPVIIQANPENNFMPKAADIKPFIQDACLLALCSPQNPTGTVFTKVDLEEICDMVLTENARRGPDQKPLYVMYDQIYWALTFGDIQHYDPISLRPEMRDYTVYVDGISKSLAATGVRIGWSMGPKKIIDKMKAILTHVGAWAPKAEQMACARFLNDLSSYDEFLRIQKMKISDRLEGFYKGFMQLKAEGFHVDAIAPQAAIYLTIQFKLIGMKTAEGNILEQTTDITRYILDEGKVAVVPFSAFGADKNSTWFRLSVGTCSMEDVNDAIESLRRALQKLS
jgi:aspartate aminotransferase